jgi:2-polyprenyl-6-methoxyphenol hydroxylase-like FAD-dependent oxidoreductase
VKLRGVSGTQKAHEVRPATTVEASKPATTTTATKPADTFAKDSATQPADAPKKTAVVSGLGPGGLLAVLKLAQLGYHVTGIEQRPDYTRHVNISLRQTYLDDLKALSPELYAKLMQIAAPIDRNEIYEFQGGAKPVPHNPAETDFEKRLTAPKAVNVSIRELEKLFHEHLQGIAAEDEKAGRPPRITLMREYSAKPQHDPQTDTYKITAEPWRYSEKKASMTPKELGTPDLFVIAEGGKSTSARAVGMEMQRLSRSRTFVSGHVPESLGNVTRRVNAELMVEHPVGDAPTARDQVSLWATGHTDKGTWLLMEVPDSMKIDSAHVALDLFLAGKALLFNPTPEQAREFKHTELADPSVPDVHAHAEKPPQYTTGFGGIFNFEQQLMPKPTAGKNVVAMGDAGGMTHADLSAGLEIGIHDLAALTVLASSIQRGEAPERAMETYGSTLYQTRLDALSLGMKEFYPDVNPFPKELLDRASRISSENDRLVPHEVLERLLERKRDAA